MNQKFVVGHYKESKREKLYFSLRLVFSFVVYAAIVIAFIFIYTGTLEELAAYVVISLPVIVLIVVMLVVRHGLIVGIIKSFAVKINKS